MTNAFKVGDVVIYYANPNYGVPRYHQQACEVIGLSGAISGDMLRVKFSDGGELSVFSTSVGRLPMKVDLDGSQVSRKLYLIGSLRNPKVQEIAAEFRRLLPGWEVFDDWQAAGPEADDYWRDYEKAKGHDFTKALQGHAAKHVYDFDKHHLDTSDAAVLILPAGKSGHLELGYMVGKGKYTAIMLDDDPERFDVMYQFVDKVTRSVAEIVEDLNAKD